MPIPAEPTWEEAKAQGRARYFQRENTFLRRTFYLRLMEHGAIIRSCKDPRDTEAQLAKMFPDCWSRPSRWYYDHLYSEKRRLARAWMCGQPDPPPMSNSLLDHFLGGRHAR